MTCRYPHPASPTPLLILIARLHGLSPPTRPHKIAHIFGMDCRTRVRPHNAADCRRYYRSFDFQIWQTATVHGGRFNHSGSLSASSGLDKGDSWSFRGGERV